MTSPNRRQLLTGGAGVAGAAAFGLAATPASAGTLGRTTAYTSTANDPNRKVTPGADVAAAANWSVLAGRKVGIITNPTGVLLNLRTIVDEMHDAGTVDIRGVFGPEHGFRGTAQAGEAEDTYVDERTGITVYDAYGANTAKFASMIRASGTDTVVFDIQDVGCRFYTYIWTMYTAMKACVETGASMAVLDRPNPIGGTAYGPMMTDPWTSGVGAENIVQAHGMTVGEMARYLDAIILPTDTNGARLSKLEVVECKGWRRDVTYAGTGLPWVMPSPNMPTPDTALVYPGTGMFEGTNLSEGRGTTRPFELIGAPYVDYKWAERLAGRDVAGVAFREAYFTPTFNKHVGKVCGGVQVHIVEPSAIDPMRVGVEMLVAARSIYTDFQWRYDAYDPARPYWIDKLSGSTRLRDQITAGADVETVMGAWKDELAAFDARRQPFLIYGGPTR
ncbi:MULTISPECIES: exo-beta-N-acetylmuramidase NamZ domain-containing protein [unclassified Knoellia]|uniref:exo-beta-N-acetylmuramidase NamZ family protein n=1 Tax=Knoellia altitudinis TaxID=3404795 RepID=UPI003621F93B